jgi:hypothetical protein
MMIFYSYVSLPEGKTWNSEGPFGIFGIFGRQLLELPWLIMVFLVEHDKKMDVNGC